MPFQLIWSNRSKKDLKLLDKPVAERIYFKLLELEGMETVFLEKVSGTDFSKFRVGDYRVFIRKLPAMQKLFVLRVMHRKKAYKNL